MRSVKCRAQRSISSRRRSAVSTGQIDVADAVRAELDSGLRELARPSPSSSSGRGGTFAPANPRGPPSFPVGTNTTHANSRSRSMGKAAVAKSAKPSSKVINTRLVLSRRARDASPRIPGKSWSESRCLARTSICIRKVSAAMLVGPRRRRDRMIGEHRQHVGMGARPASVLDDVSLEHLGGIAAICASSKPAVATADNRPPHAPSRARGACCRGRTGPGDRRSAVRARRRPNRPCDQARARSFDHRPDRRRRGAG